MRAEDAHARAGPSGAAADAVRDRGLEQVGVVAGRDAQIGRAARRSPRRLRRASRRPRRRMRLPCRHRRADSARTASACSAAMRGERLRALDLFQRRQRGAERARPAPARHRDRRRASLPARIGADAASSFGGAERRERMREPASCPGAAAARAAPPAPAPRSARVCAPAAAPSRKRACLSSASSVTGARPLERGLRHEPREHAGLGVGQRIAAGIVGLDVPAPERGDDAARQRAVGRHQRGGLVLVHRLAQRDRDGERLVLGIGGLDHGEACERRVARRVIDALRPALGRVRRPHRLGGEPFARRRLRRARATSSRAMPMRRSSACMASCGWPNAGLPMRSPSRCRRSAPRRASSRSVSSPGSTTAPCGSFAMVASSFAVAGIEPVEPAAITGPSCDREPYALGLDQQVAPRRRLDRAALVEQLGRPVLARRSCRKSSVSCQ